MADPSEWDHSYQPKWMELAFEQAMKALPLGEVPVGCVFVWRNERVFASAHNETTHSKCGILHCEINCIQGCSDQSLFKESVLYVTVEPCIMCASALSLIGVSQVYYGCANPKFGGNGSVISVNNGIYPSEGGFQKDRAIGILKSFYESGNLRIRPSKRARKNPKPLVFASDSISQSNNDSHDSVMSSSVSSLK